MGDFFHDAALDLLDTGLAVDDDIVKAVGQDADDFLQIGVDLAVAAGALRTADGQECKLLFFHQSIEDAEACLAEKLQSFAGLAVFHGVHNAHADVVQSHLDINAKSHGQTHCGVGIDGQDLAVRISLSKQTDHACGQRSFANAAFAGDGYDLRFFFHVINSSKWYLNRGSVVLFTGGSSAEVQLFHSFYFVTDIFQGADRAVGRQTFQDVGEGRGDAVSQLCVLDEFVEVNGRIRDEDDLHVQYVGIFFIFFDVICADGFEINFFLNSLLGNADLLTMRFRRHADHISFREYVVFAELDVFQSAVNDFIVVIQNTNADDGDTAKGNVVFCLNLRHIRSNEDDLIFVLHLRRRRGAQEANGTRAGGTHFIGGVRLKDQFTGTGVVPCVFLSIIPSGFFGFFNYFVGLFDYFII